MDQKDLVAKITAEVLSRLQGDAGTPKQSSFPPPTGVPRVARGVLVLLTGGNRHVDQVVHQIGKIAEGASVIKVAFSSTAQSCVGLPAIRRVAPNAQLLTAGNIWQVLENVDTVCMPSMSTHMLSKLVHLQPDSWVPILAFTALTKGLRVIGCAESMLPAEIDPACVPAALRKRLDELVASARELGMELCPLDRLTDRVLSADGSPVCPTTGAQRTYGCDAQTGECTACGLCVERRPEDVEKMVSSGAGRVAATVGAPVAAELARYIDHTLLKPDATEDQFRKLCAEARQHSFASVCVNPSWVALCAGLLKGSPVKVCTVIGFPLGATTPTTKGIETRDAIANGAGEIDMVINVGALKSGNDALVKEDIEAVVAAAKGHAIVKVILETALLTREEKIKACLLSKMAGADFVKTSTGFVPGGATVEDIALMRETVGPDMGVKASGGIRDTKTAADMVAAGATRLGASASVAIISGQAASGKGY
jgi:deoxyribose-phosphate aldolase